MAAGEVDHPSVARGIHYLQHTQAKEDCGRKSITRAAASRAVNLRYHGYRNLPLWAVARYRNLKAGNARHVAYGL